MGVLLEGKRIVEETLEVTNTMRICCALQQLNLVLEETRHSNRDTMHLAQLIPRLEKIVKYNLKEKEDGT